MLENILKGSKSTTPPPAPEFVGYVAINNNTVDISSLNVQAGDVGIILIGSSGSTVPSGWTVIRAATYSDSGYTVFSGGETTITFSATTISEGIALLAVYRGYSVASSSGNVGISGTPSGSNVSALNGDVVYTAAYLDDDIITMTVPSGYTEITSGTIGVTNTGCSYASGYKNITSSGTETPGTFGGGGDDAWGTVTVALRPL